MQPETAPIMGPTHIGCGNRMWIWTEDGYAECTRCGYVRRPKVCPHGYGRGVGFCEICR